MIATARKDDRTFAERREIAFHEAGHAVTALALGCRLFSATILIGEHNWGHVTCRPPLDVTRRIALLVAGHVAEVLLNQQRRPINNAEDDMVKVSDALLAIYPTGSETTPREFIEGALLAVKLVKLHRKAIRRIANRLLARNTLDGAAVCRLMQQGGRYATHR